MNPLETDAALMIFYYPTMGGGDIKVEYNAGKSLQGKFYKTTKTPGKLRKYIAAGATDIVVMGHSAEPGNAATDGKISGGGGGCLFREPKKDATGIGADLAGILANSQVQNVWIWTCYSSTNGVAVAIRNAIDIDKINVYGTPMAVGSPFYYQNQINQNIHLAPEEEKVFKNTLINLVGADSFVLIKRNLESPDTI